MFRQILESVNWTEAMRANVPSNLRKCGSRGRNESKRLLNVAKTAVEIAIGESEEAALEYLKENENG